SCCATGFPGARTLPTERCEAFCPPNRNDGGVIRSKCCCIASMRVGSLSGSSCDKSRFADSTAGAGCPWLEISDGNNNGVTCSRTHGPPKYPRRRRTDAASGFQGLASPCQIAFHAIQSLALSESITSKNSATYWARTS